MKQTKKRSGVLWNALGSMMFGASSMLLLMTVSLLLGTESAGAFSIAFTTAQMLYLVGIFGASHIQMTDYAHKFSNRSYFRVKLFSTALAMLCCVAAIWALGFTADKALLTAVLTAYMLMHSVADYYQSLLFRQDRLDLSGQSLFVRTLVSFVGFAVALVITRDLMFACVSLVITGAIGLWVWAIRPSKPYLQGDEGVDRLEYKQLFISCLPMFASLFLMNVIINAPKYVIERYWSDTVQGVFGMIFMPAQVINLLSGFIFKPILKRLYGIVDNRDTAGLKTMLLRQMLMILGLTFAGMLCAWVAGPEVLGWLYGANLLAYRMALTVVILGGGVFACCQLLYFIIILLGRLNRILLNYLIATAAAIALSVLLVTRYDVLGGAAAFLLTHVLLLALYLLTLWRAWKERPNG